MTDKTPPEKKQERYPLANTKAGRKLRDEVVDKTGFEPADMLEAPARPPEPRNVEPTYSTLQFVLILAGGLLAAIGLLILVVLEQAAVGIVLMIIGATGVAVGTLVRV